MSDAPAAPVTEQGVPPVTQSEEVPSFKVFVGNLAYSTTDEGLKAFFEPVQSDMYDFFSPSLTSCTASCNHNADHLNSISAQVILRGTRSAGYGFVALSTAEAAQNAVDLLDKKLLDERPIIVEIAKPADQKEKERKDRKPRRRPGRRGSRPVTGEVTDAEANGEAKPEDAPATEEGESTKPKKKKKKSTRKPRVTVTVTEGVAEGETEPTAPTSEGESKPARKRRPFRPRRTSDEEPTGEPSKSVLFVANLGFNIDDTALTELFTEAGVNVVSARIVRRQFGRPRKSKGYGFVDVGNEEEQQKAIAALEGKEVEGRAIAVKIAVNAQGDEANEEKAVVEEEGTPEDATVDT
ncbi:hypothetical protein V8E53_001862 [Lactarius tabidus]